MEEPPDESRLDLSFLLNQAAYAFEARLAEALAEHGLSVREYCVLWKADEGERTQQEIAELAGLDKSTLVVTLDKLEAAGLVERRVSDADRRARVVGVTPQGAGLYLDAQQVVDRVTVETLRHLGARGMQQFVQGLQRLTEGEGPLAAPSHVHPQRRKEVRRRSSTTG
jgi:MarR family transcriptional regulator, transcriptional regulator for hemolysin